MVATRKVGWTIERLVGDILFAIFLDNSCGGEVDVSKICLNYCRYFIFARRILISNYTYNWDIIIDARQAASCICLLYIYKFYILAVIVGIVDMMVTSFKNDCFGSYVVRQVCGTRFAVIIIASENARRLSIYTCSLKLNAERRRFW